MRENIIQRKSFDFALSIIELYKDLIKNKEFIISKQLLRSSTSIGANVSEASAAQNLSSIIKISFRPLRNSKIRNKVTKMYRDTLKELYEVDYLRCYFVVLFISGILFSFA